jgi:hemerythrin-like domain-containing protein
MTITLVEIFEKLKQRYDPDELVELLEISSEELVDRFEDKIEDRYYEVLEELEEEEEE